MKAALVKELHKLGVYRDPQTKQKLECMKLVDILRIKNLVEEEIENGAVFEKKVEAYEFIDVSKLKKEKDGKKKKR